MKSRDLSDKHHTIRYESMIYERVKNSNIKEKGHEQEELMEALSKQPLSKTPPVEAKSFWDGV